MSDYDINNYIDYLRDTHPLTEVEEEGGWRTESWSPEELVGVLQSHEPGQAPYQAAREEVLRRLRDSPRKDECDCGHKRIAHGPVGGVCGRMGCGCPAFRIDGIDHDKAIILLLCMFLAVFLILILTV